MEIQSPTAPLAASLKLSRILAMLDAHGHTATPTPCPLVIRAESIEVSRDGTARAEWHNLPADFGAIRRWLGY